MGPIFNWGSIGNSFFLVYTHIRTIWSSVGGPGNPIFSIGLKKYLKDKRNLNFVNPIAQQAIPHTVS